MFELLPHAAEPDILLGYELISRRLMNDGQILMTVLVADSEAGPWFATLRRMELDTDDFGWLSWPKTSNTNTDIVSFHFSPPQSCLTR